MNAPKKKCECGAWILADDCDGDRAWYAEHCEFCEQKLLHKCAEFARILADSSESECMRFMSYIVKRLEYLRSEEMKRLANVHLSN